MLLSILIPVFNEEKTIKDIIEKVQASKLPKSVKREIIVINDASTDNTSGILQKISGVKRVEHSKNRGKGAAIRSGLQSARGQIILIQDADLEYDPSYYYALLKPILTGRTKVVYGTRLKHYPLKLFGKNKTPLVTHFIGNKLLSFITKLLYLTNLSDMETCYKVFTKEVLQGITLHAERFDFEPEITAKILKRGYKIFEVPISVKPRGYIDGKKISWRDGFVALWTLIKYRFID